MVIEHSINTISNLTIGILTIFFFEFSHVYRAVGRGLLYLLIIKTVYIMIYVFEKCNLSYMEYHDIKHLCDSVRSPNKYHRACKHYVRSFCILL